MRIPEQLNIEQENKPSKQTFLENVITNVVVDVMQND